jgi:hypothetical protein
MKEVIKKALLALFKRDLDEPIPDFKTGMGVVYAALSPEELLELKSLSLNEVLRSTKIEDLIDLGVHIQNMQNK